MGLEFPLPRSYLPDIRVTPEEHAATKHLMDRMLQHTVQEFERLAYINDGKVDLGQWKPVASRDQLKVYRERDAGTMSANLGAALQDTKLPLGSAVAALASPSMLLSGFVPGRMENAMHAVVAKNQEELALAVVYLHDLVADCALLGTMERPTKETPYNYLGYKYLVIKSPGFSQLIKHRDGIYLEYTGLTTTSTGETLGFHLTHSVDLPGFPELSEWNSITGLVSLRYLYRQTADNVVQVFMLGNLDISGLLGTFKPIASAFEAEVMFGCTRLVDCAETKRLTQMVKERHHTSDIVVLEKPNHDGCSSCEQKHKFSLFSVRNMLVACAACGQFICSHCRIHKRVFVSDGILGRFRKVLCCKTCVFIANGGYNYQRMSSSTSSSDDLLISSRRRRNTTKTSSGSIALVRLATH